jgi:hypothetical protein
MRRAISREMALTKEVQAHIIGSFRLGNGDRCRQIKMSSYGYSGRRKFVVELVEKKAE